MTTSRCARQVLRMYHFFPSHWRGIIDGSCWFILNGSLSSMCGKARNIGHMNLLCPLSPPLSFVFCKEMQDNGFIFPLFCLKSNITFLSELFLWRTWWFERGVDLGLAPRRSLSSSVPVGLSWLTICKSMQGKANNQWWPRYLVSRFLFYHMILFEVLHHLFGWISPPFPSTFRTTRCYVPLQCSHAITYSLVLRKYHAWKEETEKGIITLLAAVEGGDAACLVWVPFLPDLERKFACSWGVFYCVCVCMYVFLYLHMTMK
jgi:hypothetical protein